MRRAPGYGFALLGWPGVPTAPQTENGPSVTVNDLLIASLILAILRWNASAHSAPHRRPGRVRISMPVDARPPGRGDELGNLSRLCRVAADPLEHRRPDHRRGRPDQASQAPARSARQSGPGGSGQGAAADLGQAAPAAAGRALPGRVDCDTSLLSNLGNITEAPRFGVLSPARMWFSTSAHMPRGLSVGAITVDGRLHLCFRYRHALFDSAAAHDFVAEYAAALDALAGTEARAALPPATE